MSDRPTDPSKEGSRPNVSARVQERALREYNTTQARIREMVAEKAAERDPAPTTIAPTRHALEFSRQERMAMCAMYYDGVPIRRIAAEFGTSAKVVRTIVKMGISVLTAFCMAETLPWSWFFVIVV